MVYTPDMVLGADRKGLKVTYCTDSRPTASIAAHAADSDLFICEGMYGEPEKQQKAREHKHMTMAEAAEIAREAKVKELWLTHYSPSMVHPKWYLNDTRKIFPAAYLGEDGKTLEMKFEEDEE